jgi:hypothetical protein
VTVTEVLVEALGVLVDDIEHVDRLRVGRQLRALGWQRRQERQPAGRRWRYDHPHGPGSFRLLALEKTEP